MIDQSFASLYLIDCIVSTLLLLQPLMQSNIHTDIYPHTNKLVWNTASRDYVYIGMYTYE